MALWYTSVVPGVEELAAQLIGDSGSDVTTLSGALLITSVKMPDEAFINNVFRVLVKERCGGLPDALDKAERRLAGLAFPKMAGTTFRLVVMEGGTLRAIPPETMLRFEMNIGRASGLKPRRANPDNEIWLNVRSEGFYTLMLRIGKHKPFDKSLAPGQLRPDLCALLAAIPPHGDVALDPFAGSGALAAALITRFRRVIAMDTDIFKVASIKKMHRGVDARQGDAMNTGLPDASMDAIVTDPPWGVYEKVWDIDALYGNFVAEARRILKPAGMLIMLTSYDATTVIDKYFIGHIRYPVLISGRSAAVYVATKQ